MKVEIVRTVADHLCPVGARVREADRAELWALACLPPYEALVRSWGTSDHSWTGLFDGVPVAVFGVTQGSLITDTGRPWMIGTDMLDRHPLSFIKECKRFMPEIRREYARLENYVDARNTRAIRWLGWLGFQFEDAAPYGVLKLPFHKFAMERN